MEAAQSRSAAFDVEGKVAIVTGGAQGIGLATVKLLLKNGAKVNILDINEEVGQTTCTELQNEYSTKNVLFICCDVSNQEQLKSAFQKTKKEFGGLDIVCNNAGIGAEDPWRKTLDINLYAVIEGTYLAMEYMSTKNGGKGGVVVNTSSMAGILPVPIMPVYSASKHGVVGFTMSLKERSSSDGVRVNCICPGLTDTLMLTRDLLGSNLVDEEMKARVLSTMISPNLVAEGILELISDTSKSGEAMVANQKGLTYHTPPVKEYT